MNKHNNKTNKEEKQQQPTCSGKSILKKWYEKMLLTLRDENSRKENIYRNQLNNQPQQASKQPARPMCQRP